MSYVYITSRVNGSEVLKEDSRSRTTESEWLAFGRMEFCIVDMGLRIVIGW